ncbi:4355_t:CDS:2, partial [Rhizophagus irregularis]
KPFKLKIDLYLKALEIIINSEQGKRRDKAKLLNDDYKKATSRNLSLLMTTPNKRPLKRKIQQYTKCISVICAFRNSLRVDLEVGKDLTIELSTVHDANPAV